MKSLRFSKQYCIYLSVLSERMRLDCNNQFIVYEGQLLAKRCCVRTRDGVLHICMYAEAA